MSDIVFVFLNVKVISDQAGMIGEESRVFPSYFI